MIRGFIGGMSCGKTAAMTSYLKNDFDKGRTILANYRLKFPSEIITPSHIMDYAKQRVNLYETSIGLDEIYLYIDSRVAAKKMNRIYSYFALQTSKRDVNLNYTAQNFHTVDKRIRDNTHELIQCYPVMVNDKKVRLYKPREERLLSDEELKNFYILCVIIKRSTFGFRDIITNSTKLVKVYDVKDLYDTQEIIQFDVAE